MKAGISKRRGWFGDGCVVVRGKAYPVMRMDDDSNNIAELHLRAGNVGLIRQDNPICTGGPSCIFKTPHVARAMLELAREIAKRERAGNE